MDFPLDVENIRLRASIAAMSGGHKPHEVVGQLLLSDIPALVEEIHRLRQTLAGQPRGVVWSQKNYTSC
jgi:hypothetical protein